MRKLGLLAVSGVLAAVPLVGVMAPADAAILRHHGKGAILKDDAILKHGAILKQGAILD